MSTGNKIVNVILAVVMGLSMSACSSMSMDKVWPFGEKNEKNQPRRLLNATEYQCDAGKRFYLRYVDNGAGAWLIYPDREVFLKKEGTRYSNGVAVIEQSGNELALVDGPTIDYKACKAAGR